MSLDPELDGTNGTSPEKARSSQPRAPVATKVVVGLSEQTFQKLEAATDRPGLSKSMVVEAALACFLDPAPPIESPVQEALARITRQLERLDGDVRIIAETVALHARYHLTIAPSISEPRQQRACARGQERFLILAEQVDRRVRLDRPLMRETIDQVNASKAEGCELSATSLLSAIHDQGSCADTTAEPSAAAEEDGSDRNFPHPDAGS